MFPRNTIFLFFFLIWQEAETGPEEIPKTKDADLSVREKPEETSKDYDKLEQASHDATKQTDTPANTEHQLPTGNLQSPLNTFGQCPAVSHNRPK